MVLGPVALFSFLAAVPLLDRDRGDASRAGRQVGWAGLAVGFVVLSLWLYGLFGETQQHIGM